MEVKKSPKADLQGYKPTFFLTGLVVTLCCVLLIFNCERQETLDTEIIETQGPAIEQEVIPMTMQDEPPPVQAPPEAPKVITKINLVDHEVDLDDDVDPFDTELDEDQGVDIYEWKDEEEEEEEVDEDAIFFIVEEMPKFQNGDLNKFRHWVASRLRYPEAAAAVGLQGKVQIKFVVERDGSVTNVKVVRGVDPLLDEEALRVVKQSPKWTPGKQRGKPARVGYTIPVVFYLRS